MLSEEAVKCLAGELVNMNIFVLHLLVRGATFVCQKS